MTGYSVPLEFVEFEARHPNRLDTMVQTVTSGTALYSLRNFRSQTVTKVLVVTVGHNKKPIEFNVVPGVTVR
jgi:hypothetical protein